MTGLSEDLGVTQRNITALVDALQQEGLVRRLPHPTDRRATVIELTEEGSRVMDTLYDAHRGAVAELFQTLSRKDQQELVRLLGLLRAGLGREDAGYKVPPIVS